AALDHLRQLEDRHPGQDRLGALLARIRDRGDADDRVPRSGERRPDDRTDESSTDDADPEPPGALFRAHTGASPERQRCEVSRRAELMALSATCPKKVSACSKSMAPSCARMGPETVCSEMSARPSIR